MFLSYIYSTSSYQYVSSTLVSVHSVYSIPFFDYLAIVILIIVPIYFAFKFYKYVNF